jgi:hypothetical protein
MQTAIFMAGKNTLNDELAASMTSTSIGRLVAVAVALVCWSGEARSQVTETQVPFDSAGRVRVLTPLMVTRLGLTAPAWPVQGQFREARLFASSAGGLTLVVDKTTGAVDRYALPDSGTLLRYAVNSALVRTGAIVAEEPASVVAEPARPYFIKSQLGLAWGLYGPLLASLADDEQTSSAIMLLSVPASFFIVQGVSRGLDVTRTQADMSLDGAFRGWALGAGTLYLAAGDGPSYKTYALLGLGSAIGGSVYGFKRGRRLTDGEAASATTFSNFATLTSLGIMGMAGAYERQDNARGVVGVALASLLGGYALGPRYARQRSYAVTKGDVATLSLGATLGEMVAITALGNDNFENIDRVGGFGMLTAGMLGGAYVAHRVWVRPYDNTTGDAGMTSLGALAGGLFGAGIIVLTEADNFSTAMGVVTSGAIIGSVLGHRLANAPRAHAGRVSVGFSPTALGLAAARVPGKHAAITFRF